MSLNGSHKNLGEDIDAMGRRLRCFLTRASIVFFFAKVLLDVLTFQYFLDCN